MRSPDDVPTLTDGVVTLPRPTATGKRRSSSARTSPQGWRDETELSFAIEHRRLFAGCWSNAANGGWTGWLHADDPREP